MIRTAAALVALSLGAACGSGSPDPPPIHPGTVQLDWTIASRATPAECAAHGAASLRFTLYDARGTMAGQWVQPCSSFTATVDGVAPDDYVGRAQLVDEGGVARTSMTDLGLLNVVGDETIHVPPVDFPATSFE